MPEKLAAPGLLEIKVFCDKCYDVILFVHNDTNKIILLDSNYILDVAM